MPKATLNFSTDQPEPAEYAKEQVVKLLAVCDLLELDIDWDMVEVETEVVRQSVLSGDFTLTIRGRRRKKGRRVALMEPL